MLDPNPAAAPMTEAEFAEICRIDAFVWARSYMRGLSEEHRHNLILEVQLLRSEAARAKASDRRLVLVRDAASSIADYAESQNRAMTAKLLGLVNELTQDAFDSQPPAAGAEGLVAG